jgi:hypothetical protein
MQGRNSWVGVQLCWAKNVIQQKITKILPKHCTNFDMLVNRTSPPPNNFGKRYSLATEMSVGHKLWHTLLVQQNKLTPHPVVIPRLRPTTMMIFLVLFGKVALTVLVRRLFSLGSRLSLSINIDCLICAFGSSLYYTSYSSSFDNTCPFHYTGDWTGYML